MSDWHILFVSCDFVCTILCKVIYAKISDSPEDLSEHWNIGKNAYVERLLQYVCGVYWSDFANPDSAPAVLSYVL